MENEHSLRWRRLLQAQSKVISRQQARDAGFEEDAIDRRLQSGTWQRLYRGTYATFTGDLSREAKLWAAVLRAGPGAALSHETAAEIHGLTSKPSSRIHITVPAQRNPGRPRQIRGVVIHRSRVLAPEWQPPWQLPRTSVADTVLDLIAAARTFDDAYGWISAAVGGRHARPETLSKALAARSRIRWRTWITAALQDATDGIHSPLERNYAVGVERAHGLPKARRQARRRHGSGTRYLDNLYEGYGVCVELDGAAAHPAEGRWRDTHRDNANFVLGTGTLRYGWPDATENRCRTAAEIAEVLRRRGWQGSIRLCGPGCTAARRGSRRKPPAERAIQKPVTQKPSPRGPSTRG
jgi:predicted transcriptional regulator of viral defense system